MNRSTQMSSQVPPRQFRGSVKLVADDRVLGFLSVHLYARDDRGSAWAGKVSGSDYLVWGANQQQLKLEFADGEVASVVLRAGGRLRGMGPTPANLG